MNYITEKKIYLTTQGNIIADRVIASIQDLRTDDTMESADTIIQRFSKDIRARIILIDREGIVTHDSYRVFVGEKLEHLEIKEALAGKSSSRQYRLEEYGRVLYVTVPMISGYNIVGVVLISYSIEDIYINIYRTQRAFLLLSILSVFITGFISFIFAKVISAPIEKLTEGITKMYQGNLEQKVEVIGNDELSNLSSAFNMMSTKLALVEQQRKDFVGNVSHELKTPLTSISGFVETLKSNTIEDEKTKKRFLDIIDIETERLT
ncbi:MAG: histidine kinase dimerization/phospho-acceptor domain-containing protein, partial [Thermotaleaceae bacterium]